MAARPPSPAISPFRLQINANSKRENETLVVSRIGFEKKKVALKRELRDWVARHLPCTILLPNLHLSLFSAYKSNPSSPFSSNLPLIFGHHSGFSNESATPPKPHRKEPKTPHKVLDVPYDGVCSVQWTKEGSFISIDFVSMKSPKGVSGIEKYSCVIDMKCSSHKGFSENSQGERICRICHLAFGPALDAAIVESASVTSGDFIQLGCVCIDELGIAHVYYAEVWFKLKGNRIRLPMLTFF
ncbi:uncharacterized protein LOC131635609 [Vicia villosa]|uniref:uncharacterized protein LOC131635609 n=1 Tax=Vicia villosa TaxID=3911 RepID=UPI00273BDBA3|nr:uncharacterized protein LOC131635609 [Vicia villosa]XP_058762224.1 uncharacterized protein LOC131635609 [Vicia villosa]